MTQGTCGQRQWAWESLIYWVIEADIYSGKSGAPPHHCWTTEPRAARARHYEATPRSISNRDCELDIAVNAKKRIDWSPPWKATACTSSWSSCHLGNDTGFLCPRRPFLQQRRYEDCDKKMAPPDDVATSVLRRAFNEIGHSTSKESPSQYSLLRRGL